jgi:signal transduction histidine kinase
MGRPVLKQPEFWTIVGAVAVLTAGHYVAPMHDPFWHDLFRRLYYLPIILAGFRYGPRGGLITFILISLVFVPHVLMARQMLPTQASEAVFEIPLYFLVGIVTGVLADRQRRADESLRRVERLKTLGEMAAGMAHEVKNPLAAIRSSAQVLAGRTLGREAEMAQVVVSEVDRLNRVVEDFLSYARPAPLRRESVRLGALLDSCLGLLAAVVEEKRAMVERSYPADEMPVQADPHQLRQVFLNLILNALQAIEPGGRVVLRVEPAGRSVRVSVEDNGAGIPADKLKRAFEPFFTTRPAGTGLGLPIAQRIVAEHGGRVSIESKPGSGTALRVLLPRT